MFEYRYEYCVDGVELIDLVSAAPPDRPREIAVHAAEDMHNEREYMFAVAHTLGIETDDGLFLGEFKVVKSVDSSPGRDAEFEVSDA